MERESAAAELTVRVDSYSYKEDEDPYSLASYLYSLAEKYLIESIPSAYH